MRRERTPVAPGFTLVELMITVAVIGILGLVAVPGLFAFIPKYRVDSAAKVFATEMNLARMRAIAKNRVHHVAFDLTNQELEVWEDEDGDWSTTNTAVKTVPLSRDFTNVSIDYNAVPGLDGSTIGQAATFGTTSTPVRATFRPDGLLLDPGVFYLLPTADKDRRCDRLRAVEVSRAGKVSLHRFLAQDCSAPPTEPWEEY